MTYDSAYVTAAEVRAIESSINAVYDTLLESLIAGIQAEWERRTDKVYKYNDAAESVVRNVDYVDARIVFFGTWLHDLAEVTNGDGETVALNTLELLPDVAPYYAVVSLDSVFVPGDIIEQSIAIDGYWAYSQTVPADVKQAIIREVIYRYRTRFVDDEDELPEWVQECREFYMQALGGRLV